MIELDGSDIAFTFPVDERPVKACIARMVSDGVPTLTATRRGEPVRFVITPAKRRDGRSDRTYPYSTEVIQAGDMPEGGAR